MSVRLNGCIFKLKIRTYWENITLFGIKSAQTFKNNFIANLSTIKPFYEILW